MICSDTFYNTEKEVQYGLAGVYGVMSNEALYGNYYSLMYSNIDDLCYFNRDMGSNLLQFHRHTAGTSQVYDIWVELYQGIRNANAFMEAVVLTDFDKDGAYYNEARFLRAYYHFLLAQAWGDVPLRSSAVTTHDQVMIAVTPQYDVLDWAAKEMEACIALAPEALDNTPSRIAKTTVHGILSRVYLYMGEYDKCIALAEELFGGNAASKLDDITTYYPNTRTSKETLWCIAKDNDDEGADYSPKSQLASMYFSDDAIGGTGWCEMYWSDPLIELIMRHPEDKRLTYYGQLDLTNDGTMMVHWPIIDETNNFRANANVGKVKLGEDPENLATLSFDGKNYTLKSKVVNGYTQYYITGMYTDAQDNDGFEGGTRVYVRPNVGVAKGIRQTYPAYTMSKFSWQDGDPMLSSPAVIRWAEVVLNAAEAYAHKGDVANALKYTNVIRTRAGIPTWADAAAFQAEGYADVVDVVLDERRLELCFEGHRAIDVFRNGKVLDRRYAGVHPWEELDKAQMDKRFPYCIPFAEISVSGIAGNGKQ